MRFSTAASAALVAAPLAVSAGGTLGFCLGNVNADGSCKVQSDYKADLQAIGGNTQSKLVRTYSSTDQYGNPCNTPSEVLPAAQSAGFQVLLGMWPDGGAYEAEKTAIENANISTYGDTLFGITVGSEGIYRGSYTTADLTGWISDMSSTFPGVTIGTADSWEGWANGTMDSVISSGIKLVLANGFSYWQAQALSNATASFFDDMSQAIGRVQSISGSIDGVHFMTGETGWPGDGGSNYGPAIAGTSNAASYWKSAVCGILDWGVDLFWFEAFDEPSKAAAIGQDGQSEDETHWGAFTSEREPKWSLSC